MALIASPSSSTTSRAKHYDVFLSFRGDDTRNTFISHLVADLRRKNIETFIDYALRRGDEISPSLLNAIEHSKIAIVVFSTGYASSTWCLEEFEKVIECKKSGDLIVIPVFYHVDPSVVRKQTGMFGEAFVKHGERFKQSLEKVERWRAALTETANISGFTLNGTKPEAEEIEKIVKDILEKLNRMSPIENKDLIGRESCIKKIERLLNIESNDVVAVGIRGMGGIGKTTLAREVFNKTSSQFENPYFLDDVRENSKNEGLTCWGQKHLVALLKDPDAILGSTFTKSRLLSNKILLAFDDVTCAEQMRKVIGDFKNLGPRSRIIVTTRDKQVLKNCRVDDDNIYEVKELASHDALTLFNRHAFKDNEVAISYNLLAKSVIASIGGVPLALKVLGDSLLDKTKDEWESVIHNLERIPDLDSKIEKVLKISYDGLNDRQKSIFLDIACLFKGVKKNFLVEILDDDKFSSKMGISILVDKSLINIRDNDIITMHDLLQNLGKTIVEQESQDPGEQSRLWCDDRIYGMLSTNTGTRRIEGIRLDLSKIKSINLECDVFLKMPNLKYLDFHSGGWPMTSLPYMRNLSEFACLCDWGDEPCNCLYLSPDRENVNKVHAPKGLTFVCPNLRYLCWGRYPIKSLPSNFDGEKLVALFMPSSNIKQLWESPKLLKSDKLKHINLDHSKQLERIPDLSSIPNLETLSLSDCTSLIEVHSSIAHLKKLVFLNLRGCNSLISLPSSTQSKCLEVVILSGCSNLKTVPTITCNMKRLYLDGTAISEFPLIEYPSSLRYLNLKDCSKLESLPSTFSRLKSLEFLDLSGCSKLDRLPNEFGCSSFLEVLRLSDVQIAELPDSLGQLSSLYDLDLSGSYFDCIPASIEKLYELGSLNVSNCKRLKYLPKLPLGVTDLRAHDCTSLEATDSSLLLNLVSEMTPAPRIDFGNCCKLDPNLFKTMVENPLFLSEFQRKAPRMASFVVQDGPMGSIFLPGNEIPDWFNHQNKAGSSVTFELPLHLIKKERVDLFMCVVVAPSPKNVCGIVPCVVDFSVTDKYGTLETDEIDESAVGDYILKTDHVFFFHSDIFFLSLTGRGRLPDYSGTCITIKFKFREGAEAYEMKKCGVRLLNEDHDAIGESDEESSDYSSWSEEEQQEEEEPQPKRLKF